MKQWVDDYQQHIFNFSHRCIGTVISTLHILTLATCFTDMGTGRPVSGAKTLSKHCILLRKIEGYEYEIMFNI